MPARIHLEKEKIQFDVNSGLTLVKIAEKYNCEKSTIGSFCKKNEIKLRIGIPPGTKNSRRFRAEFDDFYRLYITENKSSAQLAEIYNVNRTTIIRKLKEFKIPIDGKKKKRDLIKTGSEASAWKGGVTPLRSAIRKIKEYKDWTIKIFSRDNFTCQYCEKRGGDLNAHHIKFFSTILKENNISSKNQAGNCIELWDLNNGITLCKLCHDKIHHKTGEDK